MRLSASRILALGLAMTFIGMSSGGETFEPVVRRLVHSRYSEREQAAKQLIQIGEPALSSLRAALASEDEEARQRVERLIACIEASARQQRLLASPKLRIKFADKTITQAVSEVSKLARLPITLNVTGPQANKKITVDTGELPYWEAIEVFLKASGLGEDFSQPPEQRRSTGVSEDDPSPYDQSYEWIYAPRWLRLHFASTPMPSFTDKGIHLKVRPPSHTNHTLGNINDVSLELQADFRPGLTAAEITGIDIRKAIATDGHALELMYPEQSQQKILRTKHIKAFMGNVVGLQLPGIQMADLNIPIGGHRADLLSISMKCAGTRPKQLMELSGVLTARVVAPNDTLFTVNQIRGIADRRLTIGDGLHVCVKEVVMRLNRTAVVRVTMILNNGFQDYDPFDVPMAEHPLHFLGVERNVIFRGAGPAPDFFLTMPGGETRKAVSVAATRIVANEAGTRYEMEILFDKPESWEGVGLLAKCQRVVTVEMPFTLRDVPLPTK